MSELPRERIDRLIEEPDLLKRRLVTVGVLTQVLAAEGIEPILVGGAAVEFYTAGGYSTKDVDLALPSAPIVDQVFADLGFAKEGRFWYREDLDLLVEAPAPAGLPGETAPRTEIEVDGLRVVVIGIEDLILDRMRSAVHWRSTEDGRWARRLAALYSEEIDRDYLLSKVEVEEEQQELQSILEGLGEQ